MQVIESTYAVILRDYPEELPAKERIAAETRYARALEKQLGGPEQVAAALDTMLSLEESPPEVVSPGELTLLKAWGKASVAAGRPGSETWEKERVRTLRCGWSKRLRVLYPRPPCTPIRPGSSLPMLAIA